MWNLLDTHTLAALMTHTEAPSNYWLNLCFPRTMTFETEYIDFEKLVKGRKLAPFVAPMQKGKVLTHSGSTMTRFKPAYVKPKDALDPNKVIKRRAGEGIGGTLTPGQRTNAILMDYMQDHREIIERRFEWLAAKAIIDGKVVIESEDYPAVEVDFFRNANHTVVKTTGTFWGDSGVSIYDDLNTWISRVERAKFGGPVNRITMAPNVWEVFRKDDEVKGNLDINFRGNEANTVNRGAILGGAVSRQVGVLDGTLEIWVYNDWYEDDEGNATQFMDDSMIVLTGPNVQGVRAFGAIMDFKAQMRAMEIFSKMFEEEDPSAVYLLSQSAPLMVPVNPNATLSAQVLAAT